MSYATLAQIKARLNVSGATDDAILQAALDWATKYVEDYCDRRFESSSATRYYDVWARDAWAQDMVPGLVGRQRKDPRVLVVDDDLLSITSLTNGDGTTISSGNYDLVCLDDRGQWSKNRPRGRSSYDGIRLLMASDVSWAWSTDGYVTVVGTWGYSTVPDAKIVDICLRLAEYQYRSKAPLTTTTYLDGSSQTEKMPGFPQDALDALSPYMRLAH